MLVFAYGSNIALDDLHEYARRTGRPAPRLTPLGRAWLPDHRICFGYRSQSRGGGALDVVPAVGFAAPGVLFVAEDDETLALLDRKEGHPNFYRRQQVTVIREDGRHLRCLTWVVVAERRVEHVAPTGEYLSLVRHAWWGWDLPIDVLTAAAEGKAVNPVRELFAYGTLGTGMHRAHLLTGRRRFASTGAGVLEASHEYPALRLTSPAMCREAVGELVELGGDLTEMFSRVDAVEGFRGFGERGSLFLRTIVLVEEETRAWTYVWGQPQPFGPQLTRWCPYFSEDEFAKLLWDLGDELLRTGHCVLGPWEPSGPYIEGWGGADLLIVTRPPDGPVPAHHAVVTTPFAEELGAFVSGLYEHSRENKYGFKRRIAEAIWEAQAREPDCSSLRGEQEAALREFVRPYLEFPAG